MFTQPSVNQIASAYQGNPAPLARKVDQDKKQNGGIPKDLRQLMALNDIAEGKENAGIDQALKIPTNMPTVAQNTQQLAQQALQARMLQMAREQQRLQQKPPTVPFGTPQPDMQPQGLDSLATNVGEAYAEGGIIGFDGTGSSQFVQDIAALPEAFDDMKKRVREEDAIKAAQDRRMAQRKQEALDARSKTSFFNYLFGSPEREKEGTAKLTELSSAPLNAPEKPPATVATPPANIRSQLNLADAGIRAQPGTPPPPPAPPKVNTQAQTGVNVDSAPMPAGLQGLASSLATPGLDYQRKMLGQNENALAAAKKAAYLKEVGARDLSIYDKMAEELKARKERLNAPKSGYDATMELLEQIAQGGGRTWMEAGSRGVAGQRALQKARLAEQDTLMEKILELGGKKSEAQFAEKKGMFDLTQTEKERIIKEKTEAAKQLGLSEDKTRELIEQGLQKALDRKNQIRAAQIGAQDRDNLMSRARALMEADKTLTLDQAMQRAGEIANAGTMEGAAVRNRKAYDDAVEKLGANSRYIGMLLDKKNKPENATIRTEYENKIKELQARYGVTGQGLNALPAAQAAPLPAKNQLVVGQIYQTARGPAKWNGTAFEQ
jgi:hypothetical protein